ncbi:hypothetical protein XI09_29585 [Bradyrhizobium sp. CCBAU 11386]|nr:hypothetical protein [Bradyrhizobium sp. CCBAU 11386]
MATALKKLVTQQAIALDLPRQLDDVDREQPLDGRRRISAVIMVSLLKLLESADALRLCLGQSDRIAPWRRENAEFFGLA